MKGLAFFVWKPALEKVWPHIFVAPARDVSDTTKEKRKRAPSVGAGPVPSNAQRTKKKSKHKQGARSLVQAAIKELARKQYFGGHDKIPLSQIISDLSPKLKDVGINVPEASTWRRALGRKKD